MSKWSVLRRVGRAILVVAGVSSLAHSEEANQESDLAAAQRGFSELKTAATLDPTLQQLANPGQRELGTKIELPITVPMPTPGAATNAERPGPDRAVEGKNWLVDAMMKPKDRDLKLATREPDSVVVRRLGVTDIGQATKNAGWERPADNARPGTTAVSASAIEAAKGFNPLERYLSEWMTSRDLALLRPDRASSSIGRELDRGLTLTPAGRDAASSLETWGENPAVAVPDAMSGPPANPYLAAFASPPTPPAAPAVSPIDSAPRVRSSAVLEPPSTATPAHSPPNAAAAEHERARDEAKYFKQLKRF